MDSLYSWTQTESNVLECVSDLSFVGRRWQKNLGFFGMEKGGFLEIIKFLALATRPEGSMYLGST